MHAPKTPSNANQRLVIWPARSSGKVKTIDTILSPKKESLRPVKRWGRHRDFMALWTLNNSVCERTFTTFSNLFGTFVTIFQASKNPLNHVFKKLFPCLGGERPEQLRFRHVILPKNFLRETQFFKNWLHPLQSTV